MKMDFREETARRWSWFYIYMPKWFWRIYIPKWFWRICKESLGTA